MLIFIDVETTGLEKDDKICSIGIVAIENNEITSKYELVNEGKKIQPKASSVNHITNEMLQDRPKLVDTELFAFLNKHNNEQTTIIGHNINFDLEKLLACGFCFNGSVIDTLRVSKHLIPESESYSLQFLRYELKLYKDEKSIALACGLDSEVIPHNAVYDALIVKLLYDYHIETTPYTKMCNLSFENVLLGKFNFGKYSGQYIEDISMNDRGYLEWMLSLDDLDEDLRYSINHYLNS